MNLHCPVCHEWVSKEYMRLVKDIYICDKCREKARGK